MIVIANGVEIGEEVTKGKTTTFTLPKALQVLVVLATHYSIDAPGILGSFSNGVVTDETWKCTGEPVSSGWGTSDYDDSQWPTAVEYGNNTNPALPLWEGQGILPSAKWIWVANRTSGNIYCRVRILQH